MRAVYITGPRRVEVRCLPDPSVPPGGVLLKVLACGLCGSDLRAYREGFRIDVAEQVPGHEVAGVVTEVGPEGPEWIAPGQGLALAADVSCWRCRWCRSGFPNLCERHRLLGTHFPGGMADYLVLTPEILAGGILHPIPAGVDPEEAAMAEPLSSVLASQEEAGVGTGDWVAVFGAGPMGCLHAMLAKASGARVVVVDPAAARVEVVREMLQFDAFVTEPGDGAIAAVIDLTGGVGVDVAVVAAPSAEAVSQGILATRKRGTVVAFGGLPRSAPRAAIDINRLHYGEMTLRGSFSYRPHHHARALSVIADGKLDVRKIITHRVGLEDVEEAFRLLEDGRAVKVVAVPSLGPSGEESAVSAQRRPVV